MSSHPDLADMLGALRVNDSYFAIVFSCILAAITNIDQLGVGIVDDAVGPGVEVDRSDGLERVSLKYSDHSVIAACQKCLVKFWDKQDTLWFLESWQAPHPLRGFQVNHFKCAI